MTEKNYFKISSRNNQDPEAILTEQNYFDEKLYKCSNPRHEELHNKLFLNNDNPFISKPSQVEINSCEGKMTLHECLGALKNEIKFPLVNCLNQRLEKGKYSVSQPQGLIACLPKEGQEKHFMKNWRPITLLSVDFKLASSCRANRLKPILQNTRSQTQKGFLRGRYIGECVRIISDLIDK
jgi:hypothetical protein